MRVETDNGIDVNLMISKSRVKPMDSPSGRQKKLTISRLELLGCVILSGIIQMAREILKPYLHIEAEFLCTDSKTALFWIKNRQQQYKQWVKERTKKIRSSTDIEIWHHVAGEDNPADLTTRKFVATQLKDKTFWMKGPDWLRASVQEWPLNDVDAVYTVEVLAEMRKEEKREVETASTLLTCNTVEVIDSSRFGSFQKQHM